MFNLDRPAPKWYRKFANGWIIIIVPALTALAYGWGMKPLTLGRVCLIITFSASIAKLVEYLYSNGEVYAPANTKTEEVTLTKSTTLVDTTKKDDEPK